MTIKGKPLKEWENWLINEITPPVKVSDAEKYVLEAFLELIKKTKDEK